MKMKRLGYTWEDEYYLLHLQLTVPHAEGAAARITRSFSNGRVGTEPFVVQRGTESHRIMVCRTHPTELRFEVEYPDVATLELFRLEDRAFYPMRAHQVL